MRRAAELGGAVCVLALALGAGQGLLLELRVLEGEGAVQPAGKRVAAPLTVLVTDEVGRPVEGAAVTFRLPEEGASGVFANGLKTEVMRTGPDGRATVREIRWNRIPGPVRIRVTAVAGEARAGVLVAQYLAEHAPGQPAHSSWRPASRSRWFKFAALAGSAAAVGFTVGYVRRSPTERSAPPPPPVRLGTPTITIGRP